MGTSTCILTMFQEHGSFKLYHLYLSLSFAELYLIIFGKLLFIYIYFLQKIVVLYFSHPKASRTACPKNPSTVPDRIRCFGFQFNLILKQWALMGVASLMDNPGYVCIT